MTDVMVDVPGAVLAVRDGGGEGEVVVLLHGGLQLGLRPVRFDQR